MRTTRWILPAALAFVAVSAALLLQPAGAAEEAAFDGKKLFVETYKCNMCHSVPEADIEAKVKSESMKGPELGGKLEIEFDKVAAYVRKKGELDGVEPHKKEFKGSDEELQAIIDWLGSLEAQ